MAWTTNNNNNTARRRIRRREETKSEIDAFSEFLPFGKQKLQNNNDGTQHGELMYKHHFRTRGTAAAAAAAYIESWTINIPSYGLSPPHGWSQSSSSSSLSLSSLPRRLSLVLHLLLKHRETIKQKLFWCFFGLLGMLLLWVGWQFFAFYTEAVQICIPPPASEYYHDRPLVEYYIHGHGNGHYARSVAIVKHLNKNGIDVRMFLTPKHASVWKKSFQEDDNNSNIIHEISTTLGEQNNNEVGTTSTFPVVSLTPDVAMLDILPLLRNRILGDCRASSSSSALTTTTTTTTTHRYPQLVISDGDLPGMLRAYIGGVPSISIAHGLFFHVAEKPRFIQDNPRLSHAWDHQSSLSGRASAFSDWHIATHFCNSESQMPTGVVARPPMRPEILQMAHYRNLAQSNRAAGKDIPQKERVKNLILFGNDNANYPTSALTVPTRLRKLVMCYFRDQNGEMVIKALLEEGFDVAVFNNGGSKGDDEGDDDVSKGFLRSTQQPTKSSSLIRQGALDDALNNDDDEDEEDRPRVIHVMDRTLFVPLMHIADGVASSAGSNVMSECIYSRTPLLALYLERDDEERLNVELSRHDPSCHKPKVFGTSFERVGSTATRNPIQNNNNKTHNPDDDNNDNENQFAAFIQEVHSSRASEMFFKNTVALDDDDDDNDDDNNDDLSDTTYAPFNDPFEGLPDAAPLIMGHLTEIISKAQIPTLPAS